MVTDQLQTHLVVNTLPSKTQLSHRLLTGLLVVLLLQLKIKVNADHAGRSLPPELWKVLTSLHLVNFFHSLNNSSLIVPASDSVTMDATVVFNSMRSTTMRKVTLLSLSLFIHTLVLMEHALTNLQVLLQLMLLHTLLLLLIVPQLCKLHLFNNHCLSQSKQTKCVSSTISLVSSTIPTAVLVWIMQSSLSAMARMLHQDSNTGLSRTHGEPHGVIMVTSNSL